MVVCLATPLNSIQVGFAPETVCLLCCWMLLLLACGGSSVSNSVCLHCKVVVSTCGGSSVSLCITALGVSMWWLFRSALLHFCWLLLLLEALAWSGSLDSVSVCMVMLLLNKLSVSMRWLIWQCLVAALLPLLNKLSVSMRWLIWQYLVAALLPLLNKLSVSMRWLIWQCLVAALLPLLISMCWFFWRVVALQTILYCCRRLLSCCYSASVIL